MKAEAHTLTEALALGAREHIALVGAGGKTSLMFALTGELTRNGSRVIASTTTKVWHREALEYEQLVMIDDEPVWREKSGWGSRGSGVGRVFIGTSLLESGKVKGISPSLADEIYRGSGARYLVVEADGASGRALKAPAGNEPVIPGSVTMTVALMSLEAVNAPLNDATAFRMEQVREVTGVDPDGLLHPEALSKIFLHPAGLFKGTPEGARRVVFLNKGDLLRGETQAEDLADLLLRDRVTRIDRVILGSIKKAVHLIKTRKGGA